MKPFPLFLLVFSLLLYATSVHAQRTDPPACDSVYHGKYAYSEKLRLGYRLELSKYPGDDPALNCHLNLAQHYDKKRSARKIGSNVMISVGTPLLFMCVLVAAQSTRWHKEDTAFFVPFATCSAGVVGSGIYLRRSSKKYGAMVKDHLTQSGVYRRRL